MQTSYLIGDIGGFCKGMRQAVMTQDCFDMVGVVGSNPIAPTKENVELGRYQAAFFVPENSIGENPAENRNLLKTGYQRGRVSG